MKRFGCFCLVFLPLIIVTLIENAAVIIMIGISALTGIAGGSLSSIYDFYEQLMELISDTDYNMMIMVIYTLITIAMMGLWYYMRCEGNLHPKYFAAKFHPLMLAAIVILVPGTQLLAGYISGITGMINPVWMENYENLIEASGMDSTITIPLVLYSVILGPICEELIFRGVTMRLAERVMPFFAANIMQAVLFGVFHGNWIQGVYAFALGLFLGYVCERGGSIYYSILLHILFNAWATFVSDYLALIEETDVVDVIFFLVMLVCTIGGLLLFYLGTRKNPVPQDSRA